MKRFLLAVLFSLAAIPAQAQVNSMLQAPPCAYVDCTVNSLTATRSPGASQSTVTVSGAPFTGGTGTTTFPLFYMNTTGATTPTSFNTGGAFIGINGPSGFGGNFLDFHVNGSGTLFAVTSSGAVVANGNLNSGAGASIFWSGRSVMTSPADGQFKITNHAGSTTLFDYGVSTASTFTIVGELNVSALAQSTAADVLCYAISTGVVTYEPTGTTCTVSARRFKQDISYLSDSRMLDEVLGMKPVSFRFKKGVDDNGAQVHYGLIAEDVAKVAPELVAYEKDGQTHGVKYGDGELQSHLIGAIKAEQAEINDLKNKSASLSSEFCLGRLCVGWK